MLRLSKICVIGKIFTSVKSPVISKNCVTGLSSDASIVCSATSYNGLRSISTSRIPTESQNSTIPVIDLGKLGLDHNPDPNDSDWSRVAGEISNAFKDVGFAYIMGHGIPMAHVDRVSTEAMTFFNLPVEEKLKYVRDVENLHGYVPMNSEKTDDTSSFELRESYDLRNAQGLFFPDETVPDFRLAAADYLDSCKKLAYRLMETMALGLDFPRNFFLNHHQYIGSEGNKSAGRVLHYPPPNEDTPPGAIRLGAHTDFMTLTFLFQNDVGGLQVRGQKGVWVDAIPIKGAALVNIGELLQFWTSGKFKATEHRVIFPETELSNRKSRISVAFFISADDKTIIRPSDGTSSSTKSITAEEYIKKRTADFYRGN